MVILLNYTSYTDSSEAAGFVPTSARTPHSIQPTSLTVVALPSDSKIGVWRLKSSLLLQVHRTDKEYLAETWLEGVCEYGTGCREGEAVADLVSSLGDYLQSLEKRRATLGDSASQELAVLERLIEVKSES